MDLLNLEQWNEEAVQFIIDNKLEESTYLEFKSSGALHKLDNCKPEIAKDFSAFANSDGGLLVYGISEKKHKADSISFIDGNIFTKEWLENIILTNIFRRPENFRIFPIRFDNDISKTVYVVKIGISSVVPHIVNPLKQFFRRSNYRVLLMEEYEIRHAYARKENVKLEFGLIDIDNRKEAGLVILPNEVLCIRISIKNVGNNVADEYKVVTKLIETDHFGYDKSSIQGYLYSPLVGFSTISTTKSVAIYPEEEVSVMSFVIRMRHNLNINDTVKLKFSLYYGSTVISNDLSIPVKGVNSSLFRLTK